MTDSADRKFLRGRDSFVASIPAPYVWDEDEIIPTSVVGRDILIEDEAPTYEFPNVRPMSDAFLPPRSDFYTGSEERVRQDVINAAWDRLVETTFGIEAKDLPFPANWWPGLEVENVYASYERMGPADKAAFGKFFDPNIFPERWAAPATMFDAWDPETGAEDEFFIRYDPTRGAQQFFAMDNRTRAEYNTLMAKANLISEGWENLADYSMEGATAFASVLLEANYYGISAKQVLQRRVRLAEREDAMRRRGRGGGRGPQVKLEVPDYETLLVDAENAIRSAVGRDVDQWEYAIVADYMQKKYGEWAAAKKQAILGGNGTYEVPDPVKLTQDFVADRYAAEISRIEDTMDMRETNNLLLGAATQGTRMMGG